MILLFGVFLIFNLLLVLLKPEPENLKAEPLSYSKHVLSVLGSLIVGNLVLAIFALQVEEPFPDNILFWFFIAPFLHGSLLHLISNIGFIGILSLYEKRVGIKRYLVIFIISLLFSSLSSFLYEGGSIGISGGVFGLGAAYFIDEVNYTKKSFIINVLFFIFLVAILSLEEHIRYSSHTNMQVDHFGHMLGAVASICFVKFFPIKQKVQ